jgi:UDP-N-acetyl-D-glucosamine dehydrogenase
MSDPTPLSPALQTLMERIAGRRAKVGVIGLGYVGLPLLLAFNRAGLDATGFDIDPAKIEAINVGRSYFKHIPSTALAEALATGRFRAAPDMAELAAMDAILLCIPTPLTRRRDPDLSYVLRTGRTVAQYLRPGQLVALESTTYPGTTLEELKPLLEAGGLISGRDFLLVYSPEREDPGNLSFSTESIPKVVGGDGPLALEAGCALYGHVVRTVPVSSTATAEAVKLTENIFRAVNIAMVNELKLIYSRMGIDIWEVIEAARTKPFGFMPFYPGPGLGGHCIPIDPFYLTWKAREFDLSTRFIELAGEVNHAMPGYVVDVLAEALNQRFSRSLKNARILLIGLAYKKNVDDTRESPALALMKLLDRRGADVDYYDAYIPVLPNTREYPQYAGRRSVAWDPDAFADYDAALICTDHDDVDYAELVRACRLVVDSRNATRQVRDGREKIVPA